MHVFTSITANYLPKAGALAHSVKRVHPEALVHCVLADRLPSCPRQTLAAFDSIIHVEDLPISDLPRWLFRHRIVELCTAVKGTAFQHIAASYGPEKIFYFDPDIIVTRRFDELVQALDEHPLLLTPHLTEPERETRGIIENEQCALRHGIYNLGFLAVHMRGEGRRFIDWWADRLRRYCYDDIPAGLFTDQRWVDLAPALFDGIKILRDPHYNVATWNLSNRRATGTAPYDIDINGKPLVFYHFSGLDSGAQAAMLQRYGADSPVLLDFRKWYLARCEELGQSSLGATPCQYTRFSNGQPITDSQRLLYRQSPALMDAFEDPFDASDPARSFCHWCQRHPDALERMEPPHDLRRRIRRLVRAHAPEPALRLARSARQLLGRVESQA